MINNYSVEKYGIITMYPHDQSHGIYSVFFSKTQCYVPDNLRKRESLLIMTEFIALDVFIAYSYFCCLKLLDGA